MEGLTTTDYRLPVEDGGDLLVRWTAPQASPPGSAVLFLHGGGRVAGSVELYDPLVRTFVGWSDVPFLPVDYRLAPEDTGETAAEDGFQALTWLVQHATELGVDPDRIAVMGDSAGGGIAAAVALLARDRGIPLARQILIYPMLDDRNLVPDPQMAAAAQMFPYEDNRTGWSAAIGPHRPVTASIAPARSDDVAGVAPAYIEVGEVDIFRDEGVAYAQRLWHAGVSTELHVHPGYPHAFDVLLLADPLGDRHRLERTRVLRSI